MINFKSWTQRQVLCVAILLTLPLKVWYSLTRPLFYSGPDAETYIESTIDFGTQSFFSKDIEGMPNWPAGYPWLQSFIYRVTPENWIQSVQVLQLILFSLAIFLFYDFAKSILSSKIAFYSSLLLVLHPAWAVANGESMYENLLWVFLILGFYTLNYEANGFPCAIFGAFCFGIAVVIHPRILPIVLIFFLWVWNYKKYTTRFRIFIAGSLAILPILFLIRNRIAEGVWSLSSALNWSYFGYHPNSMVDCRRVNCIPSSIKNNPMEFLGETLFNFYAFWSPHSGNLSRGSWFHNISLLSALEKLGFSHFSMVISIFVTCFLFFLAMLGSYVAIKENLRYRIFLTLSLAYFLTTDIVIFGDNRHRLMAMFTLLPLQVLGMEKIFLRFPKTNLLIKRLNNH
jgi:4-amino-4-deoxy-L-arabinose transferase-like glycosyltransferase